MRDLLSLGSWVVVPLAAAAAAAHQLDKLQTALAGFGR